MSSFLIVWWGQCRPLYLICGGSARLLTCVVGAVFPSLIVWWGQCPPLYLFGGDSVPLFTCVVGAVSALLAV